MRTGDTGLSVGLDVEVPIPEDGVPADEACRLDFLVQARAPTHCLLSLPSEIDENAHSAPSYSSQREASKMLSAICTQLEAGARGVVYVRANPNEMKNDGAPQLSTTDRIMHVALLVGAAVAAAAPAAAAAPRRVTIMYCWYPGGLQHRHPVAAQRMATAVAINGTGAAGGGGGGGAV